MSQGTNQEQRSPRQETEPFGPAIFTYSRKQALADGVQVDVTVTAKEAGFRFPVFLTHGVFDAYVTVPTGAVGQDEAGRLWDILWMLRYAIREMRSDLSRIPFQLYVRNDNRKARLVNLVAECGAMDVDDPSPAITVMLPDED
ncbi:hypothetical protein DB354_13345 [Opitutus sp. ER46]|nr:hypothetical protein DB354_13345 [Opitutus sp. ER46]